MNVFTKAKAHQKKHPRMTWQDCIKAVSKKGKVSGKKKVAKKATKITITTKKSKPGKVQMSIGRISLHRMGSELSHLHSLESQLHKHRAMLKVKGQTATEKAGIRREIAKYMHAIRSTKKHIANLKKNI